MKAPPAGPPDDNWGDDLSDQVPDPWRPNYLKWRARIRACDANDEVIAIAGYLDAHTRINLDTADRIERAARASLAAQKATLFLTRYLRLALRTTKRLQFRLWLAALLGLTVLFSFAWLQLELQKEKALSSLREQKAHELDAAFALAGEDADVLKQLGANGVRLHCFDRTYSDGQRGFVLWSNSAFDAHVAKSQDGQPAGALYFRSAPVSDAGAPP
jgi:hypothetical protein